MGSGVERGLPFEFEDSGELTILSASEVFFSSSQDERGL